MKIKEFGMLIAALVIVLAVCVPISNYFAAEQVDVTEVDRTNSTQNYAAKSPYASASITIAYDTQTHIAAVTAAGQQFNVAYDDRSMFPLVISGIYALRFGGSGDLRLYHDNGIIQNITAASVSGGVLSVTNSSTTTTFDLTQDVWHIAKSGSYGIYAPGSFSVNKDTQIVANNFVVSFYTSTKSLRYMATGTFDRMNVSAAYSNLSTSAATDVTSETGIPTLTVTQGDGYYTVTGAQIISLGVEKTVNTGWYIAPIHYTAEIYTPNMMSTLVGLIPILLVVGLLMAVIATMLRRENSVY